MASETPTFVPRCVARTGKECRDCVECLATIPDGKVCAGCVHARRCTLIFGLESPDTQRFCNFLPSRFAATPT